MKTKIFTIAALAAATLLASCMKEITNGVKEGEPTYLGLSFTFPANSKAGTKATTDDNATEAEAAFYTADVFIYNTATGMPANYAHFDSSDFTFTGANATPDADKWTMNSGKLIPTTTGNKTIIVGLNLPADMLAEIKDQSFPAVAKLVDLARATSTSAGFVMFSTAPKQVTLVKEPGFTGENDNHPTVQVERIVAKVAVKKSETIQYVGGGYMKSLEFELNNINKKSLYIRPVDKKDHNWVSTPSTGDDALIDGRTNFIAVNESNTTVKSLSPKYCLENTTQNFLKGQITRVSVRGTWVPGVVKVYANGTSKAEGYADDPIADTQVAQTFYAVTYNNGASRGYFFNQAVANDFVADNPGATLITYTGGVCYWDIFLNPAENFDVYRNDFYLCTITKVMVPGRPTPELPDPLLPPTQTTDMMVDIEILYWNLVEQSVVLEY
ncbi:MAG: Mfa1 family fimbria major subunit [Bacteroidetes bacterium]|nr:Mfa1 family fimbria major subunit [Bacteroidota bacterium]